jgi:predicted nucleic acid-binding protein
MTVYIDTSAFFAILDRDDTNHKKAKERWIDLIKNEASLVSTNYVLIESSALIQRRLGFEALHVFQEDILPTVHIEWITEKKHLAGIAALFQASKKSLSLVDCVSFMVMRTLGVQKVFTFDNHFRDEGFDCSGR